MFTKRCGKNSSDGKIKITITRKNEPIPHMEPAFCISNCKFSARIALKSSTVPLKSIFMAKTWNLPVQNQKSITGGFRAVYSYFVFPCVRRRFFAHLHQNKPKSLFCPIQKCRKSEERD